MYLSLDGKELFEEKYAGSRSAASDSGAGGRPLEEEAEVARRKRTRGHSRRQ